MSESEIMVSICCVTYNHEKYIAECLDGFLMQKTNFKYEIIVGEDCSTDNTRIIIDEYCLKYPDKIRLITSTVNVGSIKNQLRTFDNAKGKYIAMCDGDDYWIDPLKLQKQVNFMESRLDSVICCHYSRVIDDKGELIFENPRPKKLEFEYEDVLLGKKEETRICSLMLKNKKQIIQISSHDWYYRTYGADTFLKLYALAKEGGKIYVLPEVMSVYRLHTGGIWSMIDSNLRKKRMVSDFNIIINNFQYPAHFKIKLLNIYFREFFLFDLKNRNFRPALNTIYTLTTNQGIKIGKRWLQRYIL